MAPPILFAIMLQLFEIAVLAVFVGRVVNSFIIINERINNKLPYSIKKKNRRHKTKNNYASSSSSPSRLLLSNGVDEQQQDELNESNNYDEIGKGIIDYQSNKNLFNRGEQHLSAILYEGDTVIYRTGNWYVDGVLVGGDEDAQVDYNLCRVETIQIIWTHNCEHGVIRGLNINITNTSEEDNDTNNGLQFLIRKPLVDVEFGPEQLIGRINTIKWKIASGGKTENNKDDDEDDEEVGISSIPLHENMWIGIDEV
jgi:hypothetical protein